MVGPTLASTPIGTGRPGEHGARPVGRGQGPALLAVLLCVFASLREESGFLVTRSREAAKDAKKNPAVYRTGILPVRKRGKAHNSSCLGLDPVTSSFFPCMANQYRKPSRFQ